VRDHTIRQWQALLTDAGLTAEIVHTWGLTLDFADWVARMQTTANAVAILRSLLDDAPAAAREAFQIAPGDPLSFCLKGVIIRGTK
jgi:hypothetical protein